MGVHDGIDEDLLLALDLVVAVEQQDMKTATQIEQHVEVSPMDSTHQRVIEVERVVVVVVALVQRRLKKRTAEVEQQKKTTEKGSWENSIEKQKNCSKQGEEQQEDRMELVEVEGSDALLSRSFDSMATHQS